jgi:pyrroline-5-carboxylate reductase
MFAGKKILVLGLGNMAFILLKVILKSKILRKEQVFAVSHGKKSKKFIRELDICTLQNKSVDAFDFLLLGLKPQVFKTVLPEYEQYLKEGAVIISMMAGASIKKIETVFQNINTFKVVRIMPNTPCEIGEGIVGVYSNYEKSAHHICHMFKFCGEVLTLKKESDLDILTAVSGSGPAYFYYFMEALIEKSMELGLDAELSVKLASATCRGAGSYVFENLGKLNVIHMREQVTSVGGTTESGLKILVENEVKKHVCDAVLAAYEKSKNLND